MVKIRVKHQAPLMKGDEHNNYAAFERQLREQTRPASDCKLGDAADTDSKLATLSANPQSRLAERAITRLSRPRKCQYDDEERTQAIAQKFASTTQQTCVNCPLECATTNKQDACPQRLR